MEGLPKEDYKKKVIEEVKVTETKIIDSIAENQLKEELQGNQISKEKLCADLMIEEVKILKKNKRFILVKYTIKNVGNIPISLHGATKNEIDNIAIQSHFTRSHNLTRGSIPVNLTFVKKGNRDVKGMLAPKKSFSQKLKIEISKISRFVFQSMESCSFLLKFCKFRIKIVKKKWHPIKLLYFKSIFFGNWFNYFMCLC